MRYTCEYDEASKVLLYLSLISERLCYHVYVLPDSDLREESWGRAGGRAVGSRAHTRHARPFGHHHSSADAGKLHVP